MSNALYDKGRNAFAKGEIHWLASTGDTIRICFVKSAYSQDLSNHEFFTDLGNNVVGNNGSSSRTSCPALTLIDPIAGVCDAEDVVFSAIPDTVGQLDNLVIFKDSGSDATSQLLAYIDTATGMPFTPSGSDITVQFDNGSNKIFKL
jgi:hypothetical protein